MSQIRKTDTKPELVIRRLTFARGLRYRKYGAGLLGKPDLVFASSKVVVFVDGDFWHGWRFDEWEHKLSSQYWRGKIRGNRERDIRNRNGLEAQGWTVIRVWEHEVEANPDGCVDRIEEAVRAAHRSRMPPESTTVTRRQQSRRHRSTVTREPR